MEIQTPPSINSRQFSGTTRISFVASAAGIVLTLSGMFFLMSLAAAVGLWSFRFEELPQLGIFFWIVASTSWIVCSSLGSLAAVLISRSQTKLDAYLQALISWGGSYLIFGGLTLTIAESILEPFLSLGGEGLLRAGFLGDAGSLLGSVASAWLGLRLLKSFSTKAPVVDSVDPKVGRTRWFPAWKSIELT